MRVTLLDWTDAERHIEFAARLSHGTDGQTGEDTAGFLRRVVVQRGHQSVAEHAWFRVHVPRLDIEIDTDLLCWLHANPTVCWAHNQRLQAYIAVNGRHLREARSTLGASPLQRAVVAACAHYLPSLLPDVPGDWDQEARDYDAVASPATTALLPHVTAASFLVEGVSRVTETQAVRHRMLSYTVQSGRRVPARDRSFVWPPGTYAEDERIDLAKPEDPANLCLARDRVSADLWSEYVRLRTRGVSQQDARYFLPQGMATRWVVTGTLRWWRVFVRERMAPAAQWEIRAVATEINRLLCERFGERWADAGGQ